jgi:hypothetical protein
MAWLIVLAVVALGLVWWARRNTPAQKRTRLVAELRARFQRQVHLSAPEAHAALERHVAGLRTRFPDHDEVWYLRRVLADLARDRR